MFCREVKPSISPYLDGQLDENMARRLEEHVNQCPPCRHHLSLIQAIPAALQTDRILAPRPEFTKLVMQRIIVREQIGHTTIETHYNSLSYHSASPAGRPSARSGEAHDNTDAEAEEGSDTAKIVNLAEVRAARRMSPTLYMLRFSSAAAALVMLVGMTVFIMSQNNGQGFDSPTASVYGAVSGFADTLRNALSSPLEVAAGVAIAALVLIALWYAVRTFRDTPDFSSRESQNSEASRQL